MKKLLIIEYNDGIRENLLEFLQMYGYDVLAVNNGQAGMEYIPKFIPDLIICDVMMPLMNEYQVLHSLSNLQQKKLIPFIICSSKSEKKDYLEGMELGADDYITKPFELDNLLVKVQACLVSGYRKCKSSYGHDPVPLMDQRQHLPIDVIKIF